MERNSSGLTPQTNNAIMDMHLSGRPAVRWEEATSPPICPSFWSRLFVGMIKMAGLNPEDYLATAVRRAIENPGAVTLPKDLLSERAAT
jgi:hypothetical protein